MPVKPPKFCGHCRRAHASSDECDQRVAWKQRTTSSKVTGTRRWRSLRKRHLGDEPLCRRCGRLAEQVDHIVPLAAGGAPYDDDNLQSLCTACHDAKSRVDRARPRRRDPLT